MDTETNGTQAELIDGKKIAADVRAELRESIKKWMNLGNRAPKLVAILVGDDPASQKYVQNKMLAAQDVGITSTTLNFSSDITEAELLKKIQEINDDPTIDGLIVQLPVPKHISEHKVCNAVSPMKDVDGFHNENIGRLTLNMDTMIPATAWAVLELIKRANIDTFGKNIVVCGRSKHVGLPIFLMLHSDACYELPGQEATVTICHRNTPQKDLEYYTKNADIIISATGVVGLIKPEMVKPGACVIDVGITRVIGDDGKAKLVGDVDFEGVKKVAGHITPVPGGVGPMTVAMLLSNTFKAAKNLCSQ